MQVNPLATSIAGAPAVQSGCLLLPELLKLASLGPQTQALREQRDEQQRREQPERQPCELVAGALTDNPTEIIHEAERKLAPTSQAARRQTLADQQHRATQQRQAFQRSLADAAARENRGEPGASARAAPRGLKSAALPTQAAREPSNGQTARSEPSSSKETAGNSTPGNRGESFKTNATSDVAQPAQSRPSGIMSLTARADAATNVASTGSPASERAVRSAASARAIEQLSAGRRTAGDAGAKPAVNIAKPAAAGSPTAAAAHGRGQSTQASVAAARTARAAGPEPGKSDANVERVLRVIRSQISQNHSRATLRLDPPELGTVRLHLDLHKDALSLRIETQTPVAHRLLSTEIESLRQGLESSGIQLEHVEIRPRIDRPEAGPTGATGESNQSDSPQQPGQEQNGHDWIDRQDADPTGAEHSSGQGMESSPTPPDNPPAGEPPPEPAAESLVNILA